MKYQSKSAFVRDAALEWERLWSQIEDLPIGLLSRRVQGSGDLAWSVKDILAHLYEWHRLYLKWYKIGLEDGIPDLPAPGYNWRMTRELNRVLYQKHHDSDLASIRRRVKRSHNQIMKIVDEISEKQLIQPGQFNWTGKLSLCSFVSANTSSHYRWAQKKIRQLNLASAK